MSEHGGNSAAMSEEPILSREMPENPAFNDGDEPRVGLFLAPGVFLEVGRHTQQVLAWVDGGFYWHSMESFREGLRRLGIHTIQPTPEGEENLPPIKRTSWYDVVRYLKHWLSKEGERDHALALTIEDILHRMVDVGNCPEALVLRDMTPTPDRERIKKFLRRR